MSGCSESRDPVTVATLAGVIAVPEASAAAAMPAVPMHAVPQLEHIQRQRLPRSHHRCLPTVTARAKLDVICTAP